MSDSAWFAASLIELKQFLDDLGEGLDGPSMKGVLVEPGDPIVAAIIAQLNAASVVAHTGRLVYEAKATIALLEVL